MDRIRQCRRRADHQRRRHGVGRQVSPFQNRKIRDTVAGGRFSKRPSFYEKQAVTPSMPLAPRLALAAAILLAIALGAFALEGNDSATRALQLSLILGAAFG